jgi:polyphosphate kinase
MDESKKSPYINRELSWLDFNSRVLEEALKKKNPPLERLKFLSIYSSNLDEFYMVRVGSLLDQSLSDHDFTDEISGMTAKEQLDAIYKNTSLMDEIYVRAVPSVLKALNKNNIIHLKPEDIKDQKELEENFERRIMPLLTRMVLDGKHPFPYISNNSVFCGVKLRTKNDKERTGLVLFPENIDMVIFLENKDNQIEYILIEELVLYFINKLFEKYTILESGIFKIIRNADLILDDDAISDDADYKQAMLDILKKRRWLMPVRLQTNLEENSALVKKIASKLSIKTNQTFYGYPYLYSGFAWDIIQSAQDRGMDNLLYNKIDIVYPPGLVKGESIIFKVLEKDYLLTHPYERFEAVIDLLNEAANDPDVISIKQTLYRVGNDSAIIRALAQASENGKDVTVLVELKARFDEQSNLNYATALEESGCHVIYGKDNLKVHAKSILITRKNKRSVDYICHLGTGNYNESTAKLYTDVGLLTSDRIIAEDLINFYNDLAGSEREEYQKLLVSPNGIRNAMYKLIDKEISNVNHGGKGLIIAKLNSLADKGMIDKLIEASKSGVKIQLIVRGICCLNAGINGQTENIEVRSIVGRFLEHSRIFWFFNDGDDKLFLSSADWMTRNLNRRMEIVCPVEDELIKKRLLKSLNLMLLDYGKGRSMQPNGEYVRLIKKEGYIKDSQMALYLESVNEAKLQKVDIQKDAFTTRLRKNIAKSLLKLANKISPNHI